MKPVLVYGGGVAALATALELLDRGLAVDLVGPCDPAQSPELPEGGIQMGEDAEALERDLVRTGGLGPSAAVRALAHGAAAIAEWLRRAGVPFNTRAGALEQRRLEGASASSALFVEARTADQIAWALERRLAGHASRSRLLRRVAPHHLIELTRDAGGCVNGLVAQHLVSMSFQRFEGAAVVLASAGTRRLSGSALQLVTEAPVAAAARAGALLADLDRMQLHPAALARGRQSLVLSSSLRAEGARFWVPGEGREARRGSEIPKAERDFFVEEAYPEARNFAADDLAARAVHRVSVLEERGLYDRAARRNQPRVYLDLTHLPAGHLEPRVGSELEAIAKLTGDDPWREPIAVTAATSGSLGGLWIDLEPSDDGARLDPSPKNHATSLAGLYAVGDVACLYHGACRLGGARLLADLFGARTAAAAVAAYLEQAHENDHGDASERALERAAERYQKLTEARGNESAQALAGELADALTELAFGVADGAALSARLDELGKRRGEAAGDRSGQANRGAVALRALDDALLLAAAAARSAAARAGRGEEAHGRLLCRLDADGQIEIVDEPGPHSPEAEA